MKNARQETQLQTVPKAAESQQQAECRHLSFAALSKQKNCDRPASAKLFQGWRFSPPTDIRRWNCGCFLAHQDAGPQFGGIIRRCGQENRGMLRSWDNPMCVLHHAVSSGGAATRTLHGCSRGHRRLAARRPLPAFPLTFAENDRDDMPEPDLGLAEEAAQKPESRFLPAPKTLHFWSLTLVIELYLLDAFKRPPHLVINFGHRAVLAGRFQASTPSAAAEGRCGLWPNLERKAGQRR